MFTAAEIEKMADWAIAQENKYIAQMMAANPVSEEISSMSDDELLAELMA